MSKRKSKSEIAAYNARKVLASFTVDGKVDHVSFLHEMDMRAANVGQKLTAEQYGLLGKIVAAYENELESQS